VFARVQDETVATAATVFDFAQDFAAPASPHWIMLFERSDSQLWILENFEEIQHADQF
jgi:hypothetical protein